MPYTTEVSRQHKVLIILLCDQSFSMEDPLGTSTDSRAHELARAINRFLATLVLVNTTPDCVIDRLDIAVIGYGSDDEGNPIVEPAFTGPLAGRELVSIKEVADGPGRIDKMWPGIKGEGGTPEAVLVPVWIDAKTQGNSPRCNAIVKACELIDGWIASHPQSFPPIVINISDGEVGGDLDPIPYADALKQRATHDGNVLFFTCCLSWAPGDKLLFPGNRELIPNAIAGLFLICQAFCPNKSSAGSTNTSRIFRKMHAAWRTTSTALA